jgi:hypothetical protein
MTFTRRIRHLALLLALAGLFGCTGTVEPSGTAARTGVAVGVLPQTAQVLPGGSVSFAATVTGAADTSVSWSVSETGGGVVDTAGRYVAPQATGTFHVVAKSNADPTTSATATVTVTPTPVVGVTIIPHTASVATGGSLTFSATVTGTSNTSVTWSMQEASGCGSVTRAGVYTAPAAAATCHVVATSAADGTKKDTATVTVTAPPAAVTVAVSPSSTSTNSCQSITFTATVTGSSNRTVTWSVQEASGGTVSTSGVYTAPSVAGTYHVVATSQADATKNSIATVTVSDKVLSVTVSPQVVSVSPGGSAQFTATVTTTCGQFTTTQTVTN